MRSLPAPRTETAIWFASLVTATFVASVLLTAVAGLQRVDAQAEQVLNMAGIIRGELSSVFLTRFVWDRYPEMPPPSITWDVETVLCTAPFLVCAVYAFGFRTRRPLLLLAALVGVGAAAYLVGLVALRSHSEAPVDPTYVGPWLCVMFMGPLYASLACIMASGATLVAGIVPISDRTSRQSD